MAGGRTGRGPRRRTQAASVVVPFPRSGAGARLDLARIVPSGRSLLLGVALVAAVLGAYWGARVSSVFAVDRVDVRGEAPPSVVRQVRSATADLLGTSLLTVDADEVETTVRTLPTVAGVSVDRAFPHTLVVKVAAERPVAVVRHRRAAWLVTGAGRIVGRIERGTRRAYPRIWLPRKAEVSAGTRLPSPFVSAARAVAAVNAVGLRRRVRSIRIVEDELTVVLADGPEIRLGRPQDVHLKLAVAARVFPALADNTAYLDVSVPERPVASRYLNP